jgi:hypothetical protein
VTSLWGEGQTRHFATPRPAKSELDTRIESRVLRCSLGRTKKQDAYTRTYVSSHMQQDPSAPQIVDLDRDLHSSVLLTAQSVANLPLPSFPSPLTNAPLLTQKCAFRRAQPPSPTPNSSPITDPSIPPPNPTGSPFAFTASYSPSKPQPHAFSRRDPDSATDSAHKGLRPKSSFHQSLLNLRDELTRPSDSGAYHFRAPVGIRMLIAIALLRATFISQSPTRA